MSLEKPLRGRPLTEAIREYIIQYILDHQLSPGSALPPETKLAEELGVGRGTVRAAIKALQSLGIVEIRRGNGVFVRRFNFDPVFESMSYGMRFDEVAFEELVDIRVWLETAVVEDILDRISAQDIERIEESIRLWEEAVRRGVENPKRRMDHDSKFHRELHATLGNETFLGFLEAFWLSCGELLFDCVSPEVDLADHVAILDAIKAHDLEAARRAIEANIRRCQLDGQDPTTD